jgi:hypothetical protein
VSTPDRLPEHLREPLDGVLRALYAQAEHVDVLEDEHWQLGLRMAAKARSVGSFSTLTDVEDRLALTLAELANLPREVQAHILARAYLAGLDAAAHYMEAEAKAALLCPPGQEEASASLARYCRRHADAIRLIWLPELKR